MEDSEEYGLNSFDIDPPWWGKGVTFIRNLFVNPVFQRNYRRSRIKFIVSPLSALIIGVLFSLSFNVIGIVVNYFFPSLELRLVFGFILGVLTPAGSVYYIILIYMFVVCLINNSVEASGNINRNELNLSFATPLAERDLYFGEAMPNFIKGIGLVERYVFLVIGLLIPFVLLNLDAGLRFISSDWGKDYLGIYGALTAMAAVILFAAMIIFLALNIIFMMLLLSLASAMYAATNAVMGTIIVTVLHYFGVTIIAGTISRMVFFPLFVGFGIAPLLEGFGIVSSLVISRIVYWLLIAGACAITAQAGVSNYGKIRRDGYLPISQMKQKIEETEKNY